MIISGYRVIVAKPTPKMMLSEKVPVTDEFRAEINAWMAEFFGMDQIVEDGQALISEAQRTMIVSERAYQLLKQAAEPNQWLAYPYSLSGRNAA